LLLVVILVIILLIMSILFGGFQLGKKAAPTSRQAPLSLALQARPLNQGWPRIRP
jgi:hypothetical protein